MRHRTQRPGISMLKRRLQTKALSFDKLFCLCQQIFSPSPHHQKQLQQQHQQQQQQQQQQKQLRFPTSRRK